MTTPPDHDTAARPLRLALVLSSTEDACTVFGQGRRAVVPYALPFPAPRADRVLPGHLVAVASPADGAEVVIWRWFDAVVLDDTGEQVRLWEPGHGEVLATARDAGRTRPPGSRAYLSAGLDGADWWLAGPAVARAEDADVDVAEVRRFFTAHAVWDRLT